MFIYEYGESAGKKLIGDYVSRETYVCVLDEPDNKPIDEAITEMVQSLANDHNVKIAKIDKDNLTVYAENGNTYILSHELMYNENSPYEKICKPSNLLRFIFTRPFIIDTLFFDENNELMDLTNRGKKHVENRTMVNQLHFYPIIYNDPNIILDLVAKRVLYNFNISGDIERTYSRKMDNIKPLNINDEINNTINLLFEEKKRREDTLYYISNFDGLHRYFYRNCGLTFKTILNPKEQPIINDSDYIRVNNELKNQAKLQQPAIPKFKKNVFADNIFNILREVRPANIPDINDVQNEDDLFNYLSQRRQFLNNEERAAEDHEIERRIDERLNLALLGVVRVSKKGFFDFHVYKNALFFAGSRINIANCIDHTYAGGVTWERKNDQIVPKVKKANVESRLFSCTNTIEMCIRMIKANVLDYDARAALITLNMEKDVLNTLKNI